MKRRFIFTLVLLLTALQVMLAQDEIIDLSAQGYGEGEAVKTFNGTNCTITFAKGDNDRGVVPKYYNNGAAVRVYFGNTITVAAQNGKTLSAITFVYGSGGNSNPITVNVGSFAIDTWTGSALQVVFSVGGKNGHRRVQKVEVTYESAVNSPVISGTTPFNGSTIVTITADQGTIRYTTDGSIPTQSSTIYDNPFTITQSTVVNAIAIKNNETSNVATKLFEKNAEQWSGMGTKASPYIISKAEDLGNLATRVNAGESFAGVYFKMGADISYDTGETAWDDVTSQSSQSNNYTCIGNNQYAFKGVFDGDGHTISGIRVYQQSSYNYGLFGFIDGGAVVKNLTLSDCRFTVPDCAGAIVGTVYSGSVENCHVADNVRIHGTGSTGYHGGVVGRLYLGKVIGCISAATLSVAGGKTPGRYGGITGSHEAGSIIHCLAINVKLPEASLFTVESGKRNLGAIAGYSQGTVTGCLYEGCTFGNTAASVGLGNPSNNVDTNQALDATTYVIGKESPTLIFDEDEPNPDVVEAYTNALVYQGTAYTAKDKTVTVALNNRTLYKDDSWNTLCLPFNTSLTGDLVNADICTLSTTEFDEKTGVLTLNFTPASGEDAVTSIVAGKPYLIKWATAADIKNPTFTGVTLSNTLSPVETSAVDFVGTNTSVNFTYDDNTVLYLGDGNMLYYPSADMTISPFCAYFRLRGFEAGAPADPNPDSVRGFILNFADDAVTKVEEVRDVNEVDGGNWYTLTGVKLDGKPTQSGIYIKDGRRYVIK